MNQIWRIPLAVEVIFVGFDRLNCDIVSGFICFDEANVSSSFGDDDHFDVIDSIGFRVVTPDGVALCAVTMANTATIFLSCWVDSPVTGDSLIQHKTKWMDRKYIRKRKKKNSLSVFLFLGRMDKKKSLSFHSYPTHSIDAHITRSGIARRSVHDTVRQHDREELAFWFAVQLTRSTLSAQSQRANVVSKFSVKRICQSFVLFIWTGSQVWLSPL